MVVSVFQWNWHQITDFDLDIEFIRSGEGLVCEYKAKTDETYNDSFDRVEEKTGKRLEDLSEGAEIFI